MFFVAGDNWQLGRVLLVGRQPVPRRSLVVYDAILCEIAEPDERDRVSSRGWALGYLGGGMLLAVNFVLVTLHDRRTEHGMAVRICLLSAGIWWAAFTIIPLPRHQEPRARRTSCPSRAGWSAQSFGQLWPRCKDMRGYPMTLTFLVAYLFYNDGIQTVICAASVYGEKELGFETSTVLIATILLVQFVALRRRAAVRPDRASAAARSGTILVGLVHLDASS